MVAIIRSGYRRDPPKPRRTLTGVHSDPISGIGDGHLPSKKSFWEYYLERALNDDYEQEAEWMETMDSLLIFSGLFAAFLAVFITELTKKLEPDWAEIAVTVLVHQSMQIANCTSNGCPLPAFSLPSFKPQISVTTASFLFYTSFMLVLTSAFFSILFKGWARDINKGLLSINSLENRGLERQARYDGVQKFYFPYIAKFVPLMLHFALATFLVGLMVHLRVLDHSVYGIASTTLSFCVLAWFMTHFTALFSEHSPFSSIAFSRIRETFHPKIHEFSPSEKPEVKGNAIRYLAQVTPLINNNMDIIAHAILFGDEDIDVTPAWSWNGAIKTVYQTGKVSPLLENHILKSFPLSYKEYCMDLLASSNQALPRAENSPTMEFIWALAKRLAHLQIGYAEFQPQFVEFVKTLVAESDFQSAVGRLNDLFPIQVTGIQTSAYCCQVAYAVIQGIVKIPSSLAIEEWHRLLSACLCWCEATSHTPKELLQALYITQTTSPHKAHLLNLLITLDPSGTILFDLLQYDGAEVGLFESLNFEHLAQCTGEEACYAFSAKQKWISDSRIYSSYKVSFGKAHHRAQWLSSYAAHQPKENTHMKNHLLTTLSLHQKVILLYMVDFHNCGWLNAIFQTAYDEFLAFYALSNKERLLVTTSIKLLDTAPACLAKSHKAETWAQETLPFLAHFNDIKEVIAESVQLLFTLDNAQTIDQMNDSWKALSETLSSQWDTLAFNVRRELSQCLFAPETFPLLQWINKWLLKLMSRNVLDPNISITLNTVAKTLYIVIPEQSECPEIGHLRVLLLKQQTDGPLDISDDLGGLLSERFSCIMKCIVEHWETPDKEIAELHEVDPTAPSESHGTELHTAEISPTLYSPYVVNVAQNQANERDEEEKGNEKEDKPDELKKDF